MKKEDEELISAFIEKVKDIVEIDAIVLYGSLARGDYDRRSDIDILLVVDCERPDDLLPQITHIITELKPHREIVPTMTNLKDRDESFLRNVFKEGKVLFGKILLTPGHLALEPYFLISYDLGRLKSSLQVRISRRIHGYVSKKFIKGREKVYRYKGLKDKYGAIFISPSTLILPQSLVRDFISELEDLGVKYKKFEIYM
jgi:predicted nucleotidyltransferase